MVYIYALHCPVSQGVRYVGKTKNPKTRLAAHIAKAKGKHLDHHCARWIRGLLEQGLKPRLEIIYRVQDGETWEEAEARFIAKYKAAGCDLTNLTSGGDGFHDLPVEVLKRRTEAWHKARQNPDLMQRWRASMLETFRSPEYRKASSERFKQQLSDPVKRKRFLDGARSPEVMERRREIGRARFQDAAELARHSASMKAIWNTPERREEARQRAVSLHADPEIRARRIASLKAAYAKPEVRARIIEILTDVNARPEVKAKKSASMKARWKDEEYRAKVLTEEKHKKISAKTAKRWQTHREEMMARMNQPERCARIAEAMKKRNADPAFIARRNDPEVRARQAATLKATWARRKAAQNT